jgi:hypothetical protein
MYATSGRPSFGGCPMIRTSPCWTGRRPAKMLSKVVFPQPLGPMTARNSPSSTLKLIELITCRRRGSPPEDSDTKTWLRSSTSIACDGLIGGMWSIVRVSGSLVAGRDPFAVEIDSSASIELSSGRLALSRNRSATAIGILFQVSCPKC